MEVFESLKANLVGKNARIVLPEGEEPLGRHSAAHWSNPPNSSPLFSYWFSFVGR
ncbi:phosphate acetyltransferase [Streptococcus pneumoniae]|nr:phosphate acetyltransferase [Streptococcus pneumoniae]